MACCDWRTFEESFLAAWRIKGVGEALIDWAMAKRAWMRYHCTGAEAVSLQMKVLVRDADYLWLERFKKNDKGDGGEGGVTVRPLAPNF